MRSPLTQTIQIALDLSADNDELRSMVAALTSERDALTAAHTTIASECVRYLGTIERLTQELAAEKADHEATREAWRQDRDRRSLNARTVPRHVHPEETV